MCTKYMITCSEAYTAESVELCEPENWDQLLGGTIVPFNPPHKWLEYV